MRCLKSNMDRFIEVCSKNIQTFCVGLKSNMDRFIVDNIDIESLEEKMFKIQYG